MKFAINAGTALLMTTSLATAGGLDRSGQGVGALFEDGTYVELSFGYVMPDVSGVVTSAPTVGSGNVGVDYTQLGAAFKSDLNAQVSYALILDQPYGANVAYDDTDMGYPLSGSEAEFRSTGITVLARYKLDENISFHGGIRSVTIGADSFVSVQTGNEETSFVHEASYANDTAFAGVIGAAYERPEIALRVALTYTSAMDFSHATTVVGLGDVADTEYEIPQSVNLDFQTGIAADTLLFGSVRWVEWSKTQIDSAEYPLNPIVGYDDDVFTYNLGVGRRFSDVFSGSFSVGYEKANGGVASNLSPTDGNTNVSLGGAYTLDNGVEISGGIRYIMIGDAETGVATFEDNSATAVGLKVAYTY